MNDLRAGKYDDRLFELLENPLPMYEFSTLIQEYPLPLPPTPCCTREEWTVFLAKEAKESLLKAKESLPISAIKEGKKKKKIDGRKKKIPDEKEKMVVEEKEDVVEEVEDVVKEEDVAVEEEEERIEDEEPERSKMELLYDTIIDRADKLEVKRMLGKKKKKGGLDLPSLKKRIDDGMITESDHFIEEMHELATNLPKHLDKTEASALSTFLNEFPKKQSSTPTSQRGRRRSGRGTPSEAEEIPDQPATPVTPEVAVEDKEASNDPPLRRRVGRPSKPKVLKVVKKVVAEKRTATASPTRRISKRVKKSDT